MVGHALAVLAVAGKLRQHRADRPAVRNAEAHDVDAEQGGEALRADLEAETAAMSCSGGGVAVDRDQHLVGNEGAGDRTRRNDRQAGGAVRLGGALTPPLFEGVRLRRRRQRRPSIAGAASAMPPAGAPVAAAGNGERTDEQVDEMSGKVTTTRPGNRGSTISSLPQFGSSVAPAVGLPSKHSIELRSLAVVAALPVSLILGRADRAVAS